MWPKQFWLIYGSLCLMQIIHGDLSDGNDSVLDLDLLQGNDATRDTRHGVIKEIEIKTLTGEPNYKSVNLTWGIEEIEFLENNGGEETAAAAVDDQDDYDEKSNADAVETTRSLSQIPSDYDEDDGDQLKNVFTIYYCEMQNWGPNRCNSKVVADNEIDSSDGKHKQYSMVIDNLRMATKYSFHIRSQERNRNGGGGHKKKITGRGADLGGIINANLKKNTTNGQTIIVPTKGFSAYATKCLPQASEIEIETGPYFGGRIFVETANNAAVHPNGNDLIAGGDGGDSDFGDCVIHGNPNSLQEKYIMRIDHERCGSSVHRDTLSVETFITVQENLGIFTHSTRRFIVVCNYQPDMLTVRASFSVPSRGGSAAAASTGNHHHSDDDNEWSAYGSRDRNGRERKFKLVGKDALVLKETYDGVPINSATPNDDDDGESRMLTINNNVNDDDDNKKTNNQNVNKQNNNPNDYVIKHMGMKLSENIIELDASNNNIVKNPKYLSLIQEREEINNNNRRQQRIIAAGAAGDDQNQSEIITRSHSDYTGIVIAIALSMIMVGALIFILQRENRKPGRN